MFSQRGILETSLGKISWVLTGANHAHLDTGATNIENAMSQVVRGKHYHVSVHLFYENGSWGYEIAKHGRSYITKFDSCGDHASDSAQNKIMTEVILAWAKFIADKQNLRDEAEQEYIEGQIENVTEYISVKNKELQELSNKLSALNVKKLDIMVKRGKIQDPKAVK